MLGKKSERILVVDQEGIMRDGLCALLDAEEELHVVGAIPNGAGAVEAAAIESTDVAIMEFSVANGRHTVAALRRRWPAARIVVLTSRGDDRTLDSALHAGVEGYVLKSDSRAELFAAIRSVLEGTRYLSASISDRVASGHVRGASQPGDEPHPDMLTERERQVMKCIAAGFRTRDIAERLSVSHKTVEKHRASLMRKLGLRSAAAVAAFAISNGYVVT
jgi:two-component system response regulator NreC